MVVANAGSANVSVLLGNGDGTFASALTIPIGGAFSSPRAVAVGDFNGDGAPDLAVANGEAHNVSVLLGTGTGNFAPAVNYLTGTEPYSVVVADFDGDGKLDLAAANFVSGDARCWRGTGPAASRPPFSTPAGPAGTRPRSQSPWATSTVTAGPTSQWPNYGSDDVSVLLNESPSAVVHPRSLPGVVTFSTSWSLRDSLTTGGPTPGPFTYGTRPPALVPLSGDWDGDGTKTPGIFQAGQFKLSDTDAADPAPPVTFTFGNPRGYPVSGDFNGDTLDDVAVVYNGRWELWFTGAGAAAPFTFGAGLWPSVVPVAGDWDGDGVDGIGYYCRDNLICPAGTWKLRESATEGPADYIFIYSPGHAPYPVVGDWDADGDDTVGAKTATTPADWLLNNQNDTSALDITFQFGVASDLPVVWARPDPSVVR